MRHYSLIRDTQRGMTLVELIVAMLILGFAVSAFLPLQAVVAKNIKTIQQKQQARQLANRIMEDLVFSTTAANYNTSADLAIGRNVVVIDGFTVEKVISWVDDPADGTFDDSVSPNPDPVPFDYKSISITVKAPNPFSGRLYTAAVLNSNLAREGPGDPFNGVIVKVNRIYDSGAPVAGALVTLSSSSGADSYTGITDEKGQVILAVNFPSAPPDDFEYTVNVSKSGWMLDPKPSHGNKITLNRWATKTIQMEMEIPQNIVLTFNQAHLGGQVTITRVVDNYIYSIENIPDHATSYNFTTSVYPSGTYKIDVELTAWQEDFETSKGDFVLWEGYNAGPPIQDNAWKWSAGYWQARPSTLGCLANDPGKNRLGKTIDLLPIKNIDLDWDTTIPAKLVWHHDLDNNGITSLQYMYVSKDAGVSISSPGTWIPVPSMSGTSALSGTNYYTEYILDHDFMDSACSTANGFNVRFDASGDITEFTLKDLAMICRYSGSKSFSAAETMTVKITE